MMQTKRLMTIAFFAAIAFCGTSFVAKSADAQYQLQKKYKVQVEYWFFDTDYYYWSTVYETTNQIDANFYYGLLNWAKQQGTLNSVVPNSYWRYIAVDVRLIEVYEWQRIEWQYNPVRPIGRR